MEKKKIYLLQTLNSAGHEDDTTAIVAYADQVKANADAEYLNSQVDKIRYGYGASPGLLSKKEYDLVLQAIQITDPHFNPWYDRFIVTEMDFIG